MQRIIHFCKKIFVVIINMSQPLELEKTPNLFLLPILTSFYEFYFHTF